jgi:hypothetical protein
MQISDIDNLLELSDIPPEEYQRVKDKYLSKGQSNNLQKHILGRSTAPRLRNTVRPPGENYAPVFFNRDYMIKLVHKQGWGGYILALVTWDLVIIDIDVEEIPGVPEDHLGYIKSNIDAYYPNDRFYINKTARGYHVYLVSRMVSHSSRAAIYMRIKLNADPAHGANSLYTGSSVRLTSKLTGDNNPCISEFLTAYGSGSPDPKALELYNTIQGYIKKYSRYGVDSIVNNKELMAALYEMWINVPGDFGRTHVKVASPMLLNGEGNLESNITVVPSVISAITDKVWSSFIKYRVIRPGRLEILLVQSHQQICMNNLYRILEATEDYAVGIHVQESCYFISYRDLFFVDIDHRSRLQIIFQYVRYHPEATFRVVQTNKGFHAFLTSYPIPYSDCFPLSQRLCGDSCHLLSVLHRGYSVRVNKKRKDETPYREVIKIGKAEECPRLYNLYMKHLSLYTKNSEWNCPLYLQQGTAATDILEKEGPLGNKMKM